MKKLLLAGTVALGTLTTTTLLQATPAHALSFGFQNIPTSPSELSGDPFVGNFQVDVTDQGSNSVLFQFRNLAAAGANYFIGDVYFDSPTSLLSNITRNVGNVGTVGFGNHNGAFPQGNNIGFSQDFGSKFNGGADGVDRNEVLGISFTGNYNNVIAALNNGSLRLGIHVQGIPNGTPDGASDSFVNNPTPVPTPALLPGLIAMGVGALRKKKQTEQVGQDA